MAGQEINGNKTEEFNIVNATVRVHFPDCAKDEQMERIKKATEIFLKKAVILKKKEK